MSRQIIDDEWMLYTDPDDRERQVVHHLCKGDVDKPGQHIRTHRRDKPMGGLWPVDADNKCVVCQKPVPNHVMIHMS